MMLLPAEEDRILSAGGSLGLRASEPDEVPPLLPLEAGAVVKSATPIVLPAAARFKLLLRW